MSEWKTVKLYEWQYAFNMLRKELGREPTNQELIDYVRFQENQQAKFKDNSEDGQNEENLNFAYPT